MQAQPLESNLVSEQVMETVLSKWQEKATTTSASDLTMYVYESLHIFFSFSPLRAPFTHVYTHARRAPTICHHLPPSACQTINLNSLFSLPLHLALLPPNPLAPSLPRSLALLFAGTKLCKRWILSKRCRGTGTAPTASSFCLRVRLRCTQAQLLPKQQCSVTGW